MKSPPVVIMDFLGLLNGVLNNSCSNQEVSGLKGFGPRLLAKTGAAFLLGGPGVAKIEEG